MTSDKTKKVLSAVEKRRQQVFRQKLTRTVIQLIFFIAMPGAFAAGWNGVKYIFVRIGGGDPIQGGSFIYALIALCAFTVIFGRWFCGYACAFGTLGDAVYAVSAFIQTKIFKRKKPSKLPDSLSGVLKYLKYIVAAAIVILCVTGNSSVMTGKSPWDVFSQLTALRLDIGRYTVGAVILAVIIIGMAVQERFFCRFLCPMGAVFSLLPILPTGMLKRDSESCIKNCQICDSQCPVGIKLEDDGINNGECIGCEKCTVACPKGNIAHLEARVIKNATAATVIKAVLFFILGALLGLCRFI